MTTKEPRGESLLAARLARAYPSLSAYSAATLAEELCRIERAQRRHAERCCNGDYDRSSNPRHVAVNIETGIAEERAGNRIKRRIGRWAGRFADVFPGAALRVPHPHGKRGFASAMLHSVTLQYDPRGRVLLLRLPGDAEAVGV